MDTIARLFFGFLIAFGLLTLLIWWTPAPENATGLTDTTFPTLQRSGQTQASNPGIQWLSFLYGIGIAGIFAFVLFMGARKKDPVIRKKIYRMLGIGILLYLLVYTLMVSSWWNYVATNSMDYFAGLPRPTAWMVFGMLTTPLFITFFYVRNFKSWVMTKEDEEQFKEIMAKRKNRKKGIHPV